MEKEISSGAMLGIVLIALAAIIGIGFGVFAIAKGTANTGVTNVQEKLEAVSNSEYTDYDQTIVTGTQVKSAYENFAGKSSAILIATQAVKDKMGDGAITSTAAGITKAYTAVKSVPLVGAYNNKANFEAGSKPTKSTGTTTSKTGTGYNMQNSSKGYAYPYFINYNALLAGSAQDKNSTSDDMPYMYFDTNCFRCTSGYCTKDGKVQFNYITTNLSKSGMVEFLPTSARFQSYLIKDASGTNIGVAFEQISSK